MDQLAQQKRVKDVGVDDECLCIELFSGLRLMGPLRTNPIPRTPVVPPAKAPEPAGQLAAT